MEGSLLITCEHAGNRIPEEFRMLFVDNAGIVDTHRGWDFGAWQIAGMVAQKMNAPLLGCHTTRLLVETNRSLDHKQLFSEFSSNLTQKEKEGILNSIYFPYRNAVLDKLNQLRRPLLHYSIHSFTPVLKGAERNVDIGILFDPDRKPEARRCERLKRELMKSLPAYRIKLNEPYLGKDDGLTSTLRKYFHEKDYSGIEVEVNQRIVDIPMIQAELVKSLRAVAVRFKHPL